MADVFDPNNIFIDGSIPQPYAPKEVNLQSDPTAALGGANQRQRNWCSGKLTIPALTDWPITVDGASGEWVTIFYVIQGSVPDVQYEENNVVRAYTSGGFVRMLQYRRNGVNLVIRNLHATLALTCIVHLSDYESRPNASS